MHKVAIVSHMDPDGICAAAVAARAVGEDRVQWWGSDEPFIKREIADRLESFEKILVLDLALFDNLPTHLRDRVVWIDHHPVKQVPPDILYINPRQRDKDAYVPASLLAYELFGDWAAGDVLWIALIGVVADWGVDHNQDFIQKARERYDITPSTQKEFKSSVFWSLGEMIDAAIRAGKERYVYKLLLKAEAFEEMLEDPVLKRTLEKERAEVDRVIGVHRERALFFEVEKVLGYFVEDFPNISRIAGGLLDLYPGWIIAVGKYDGQDRGWAKVSLRQSGRKGDLSVLGKRALKELTYDKYGGHPNACGGRIARKDFERFVKNLSKVVGD